ncbi:uncharacterized protein CG3556-like [Argiope bruennichi]|uniref:uncharacterized protein CG3556-like n=1 Tax=Argiope bruennichi TaxID=94029 RepID=UPI00249473D1|nr:uncharacterized protein CG3556-like [Argiope bruennichi]
MHVQLYNDPESGVFANKILHIGEGEDTDWIILFSEEFSYLVATEDKLIMQVFSKLEVNINNGEWLSERAVLSPNNDTLYSLQVGQSLTPPSPHFQYAIASLLHCFVFVLFASILSASPQCPEYDLPCEDGECIDGGLWCDSSEDCSDGSDEKCCKTSSYWNKDPNKCPSNYFKCNNGLCIPIIGRCDGFSNCEDFSDEKSCENQISSSKSDDISVPSNPVSPPEVRSSTATASTTARTTTKQPSVESESRASHDTAHGVDYSVQNVYSNLRPSHPSSLRERARTWLLSQRRSDFGWGDETPRALTALYLSDVQQSSRRNEIDMLMVKQLEVQLSLDIARNGTKPMKLTNLAFYINALTAGCKDAKNFYGEDLVQTLRNGVNAAQRESKLINPSVYLTLCINNASTYDDTRKLHDIFLSRNAAVSRIDIQALALLAFTCIFRNTNFLAASVYDGLKNQFVQRLNVGGIPGHVYEAALLAQALHELKVTQPGLLEFILKQQQEDGSFGGILATYLVLPVLAGRSFLQMNDHCGQRYSTDLAPIEVLKNSKRRKMYVQYALNYGNPPEISQRIQMQVAEGINFLDVMRLAQEINPKYKFMLDGHRDNPVVYSIGGIPNDAEKGMFWTLHLASNSNRAKGEAGRPTPYSGNIKELIPHANDEFVFWMQSI